MRLSPGAPAAGGMRRDSWTQRPDPLQFCVQWRKAKGIWYCRLRGKEATGDHLNSDKHAKIIVNYGAHAIFCGEDHEFMACPPPPGTCDGGQPMGNNGDEAMAAVTLAAMAAGSRRRLRLGAVQGV